MGFLERLSGRPAQPAPPQTAESEKSSAESTTSGTGRADVLRESAPAGLGGLSGVPSRLYDPYQGMEAAIGGKRMMFQLPDAPEFVFEEDAAFHRRSVGESVQVREWSASHGTCEPSACLKSLRP